MYVPRLPDVDFSALFLSVLFLVVFFYVLGLREKLLKDNSKSWESLLEKFLDGGKDESK